MTLQALANNTLIILRDVNNYAQSVPYAGRVWTFARDWAVLPVAALPFTVWASVHPRLTQISDAVAANPGTAAFGAITIILIASFLAPGPSKTTSLEASKTRSLEARLKAAEQQLRAQKKIIDRLDTKLKTPVKAQKPSIHLPAKPPETPQSVTALQKRFAEAGQRVEAQKAVAAGLAARGQPTQQANDELIRLLQEQMGIGEELKADYLKHGIK